MYLYGTVKPDDACNGRTGTVQCWCPTVLGEQAAHKLVKPSWCFFLFYRCDACILKKREGGGETEVESEKRETGSVCTWQTESLFCFLKDFERCSG